MSFKKCNLGKGNLGGAQQINEALNDSADWYDAYVARHTYMHGRFTHEVMSRLAIARYEWLLSTARDHILREFNDEEIYEVALCLQRQIAIPNDYPLANTVADDNGFLLKDYRTTTYVSLIDKLLALDPLQDMALRDMLEPLSHRWQPESSTLLQNIAAERRAFVPTTKSAAQLEAEKNLRSLTI